MMREIKFRAWDKQRRHMFDVEQLAYNLRGELVSIYGFGRDFSNDPEALMGEKPDLDKAVLMQYTGLHDKNGRKIYEGDIIEGVFGSRHEVRRNERPKGYKHIGKVGIVDGSVVFWPRPVENGRRMNYPGVPLTGGQRKYIYDDEIAGADSTVLGTIYENPELMEAAEHE